MNTRKIQHPGIDTFEEVSSKDLHRSEDLIEPPDVSPAEIQKRHQKTAKKDLKKGSLLDGKTVSIIILIVILGLMVLFFIREIRMDSMPSPEDEFKPSSLITKPIPYFEADRQVINRIGIVPDRAMFIPESISSSNDLTEADRQAFPDIQPIIHEFFDPLDKLPVASKTMDNEGFQLNDHLIVYYEQTNG